MVTPQSSSSLRVTKQRPIFTGARSSRGISAACWTSASIGSSFVVCKTLLSESRSALHDRIAAFALGFTLNPAEVKWLCIWHGNRCNLSLHRCMTAEHALCTLVFSNVTKIVDNPNCWTTHLLFMQAELTSVLKTS